jgi:hypothetical protein
MSMKNHSSFGSSGSVGGGAPQLSSSVSSASFLHSEININDPAVLRRRIAELEAENKRFKEAGEHGPASGASGSA